MKKIKIMVIEGSEERLARIKKSLSPLNCEIVTAKDGINGIREALHCFPDLVICNIMLPHLGGIQTMQIIQVLQQNIPALFVSEKQGVQKLVDIFPNVYDWVHDSQIEKELVAKVTSVSQAHPRNFKDVEYELEEGEYYALLSQSDRKKILIASDPGVNKTLSQNLARVPYYDVFMATNGQEALFKAVSLQPDLILITKELPIIEGTSFAQILYILGHPLQIVFLHHSKDQSFMESVAKLKGVRGVWSSQKVLSDREYFFQLLEETLKLSKEEKETLENSYKSIDIMSLFPKKAAVAKAIDEELDDPALFGEFDDINLD